MTPALQRSCSAAMAPPSAARSRTDVWGRAGCQALRRSQCQAIAAVSIEGLVVINKAELDGWDAVTGAPPSGATGPHLLAMRLLAGHAVGGVWAAEAAGVQRVGHQLRGGRGERAWACYQVPVAVQRGGGDRDLGQLAAGELGGDGVA